MSNNSIYAILVDSSLAIRDALPPALETLANVKVSASAGTAREGITRIREHASGWGLVVLEVGLDRGGGFDMLRSCLGRARHQQQGQDKGVQVVFHVRLRDVIETTGYPGALARARAFGPAAAQMG